MARRSPAVDELFRRVRNGHGFVRFGAMAREHPLLYLSMDTLLIVDSGSDHAVTSPSRTAKNQQESEDVTASEVACYAYCAKAWHLEHVLHLSPPGEVTNRRELGVTDHESHGRRVRLMSTLVSRRSKVMLALLLVAILAATIAALI